MQSNKHIYSLIYDDTERELSKLESKYIFNTEDTAKLIFSDICVEPSSSAFIKSRVDVISFSEDYATLIDQIKAKSMSVEGFKVEYLVFPGDETEYSQRLEKLRDIGYSIEGIADYQNPTTIYSICYGNGVWYFGELVKNDGNWHKHNDKPCSYSNSISINIAKALVNIGGKGDRSNKLIDACCGVGTIMLEACFSEVDIEGCEINWKICRNARENLSYFNYQANVFRSDIKDITKRYDAGIIDLPYNLVSCSSESDVLHIIQATAEITDRLIIVSTSDISNLITSVGFRISDRCSVSKRGKRKFSRKIWVCEKGVV